MKTFLVIMFILFVAMDYLGVASRPDNRKFCHVFMNTSGMVTKTILLGATIACATEK